MAEPRNIVLLGATGSIGQSTLAVVREHPDRFRLLGVAARKNEQALRDIAGEFAVPHTCLSGERGVDCLIELALLPEADVVVVATTGTVGVQPTIAALEAGKTVALANKETMVMAGSFVMEAARRSKGRLLPVDSEHNAIFQCLEGMKGKAQLKRILLTASGGPFLHHTRRELENVTVEEALRHPNWEMGEKVTVDSATMANKGLEMMEAHWLFDARPDQIEVVIHPQSIIHGMVEFIDGSVIAQMAPTSMTFPIQHALAYPEKATPALPTLDFTRIHRLELRPPDPGKFPCLRLAVEAMRSGGLSPVVYNTANETAVRAFLGKRLSYLRIPQFIEHCLQNAGFATPSTLQELIELETVIADFSEGQLKQFSP